MTPDREAAFFEAFRLRVGDVVHDTLQAMETEPPAEAARLYRRLTMNVMLLAAHLHTDDQSGADTGEGAFLNLAQQAHVAALLPDGST